MKKTSFLICMAALFLIITGPGARGEVKRDRLHQLHHEIVLLNLVNGLYLTPEQMESLIKKIEEAEAARQDFTEEIERRKAEVEDVLEEVREVLMKGEEIPDDLKQSVHRMKEIQHRLEDERGKKLTRLESDVEALLTENQRIVIVDYKPCTIPPAQGKIGQSVETAAEGIARALTRIRRMPRDRYEMMKDMFADFHIDKVERHLGFQTPEEKEVYRNELLDTFEKARTLSDQDFFVQKGELAQSLLPEDARVLKRRKNQLSKLGFFLLDPDLLPILKKRLKG